MDDTYLYIGNLPFDADEDMIHEAIEAVVEVEEVRLAVDPSSERFLGYAFAKLGSASDVAKVIEKLDGMPIGGRDCFLDTAENQPDLWEKVYSEDDDEEPDEDDS